MHKLGRILIQVEFKLYKMNLCNKFYQNLLTLGTMGNQSSLKERL